MDVFLEPNLWPPPAPHPTSFSLPQGFVTLVLKVLRTPQSPGSATSQKAFPSPSLIPVTLMTSPIAALLQGAFSKLSILNMDFGEDVKYRERRWMVLMVEVNPGLQVTLLPCHNPCTGPPWVSSSLSYVKKSFKMLYQSGGVSRCSCGLYQGFFFLPAALFVPPWFTPTFWWAPASQPSTEENHLSLKSMKHPRSQLALALISPPLPFHVQTAWWPEASPLIIFLQVLEYLLLFFTAQSWTSTAGQEPSFSFSENI